MYKLRYERKIASGKRFFRYFSIAAAMNLFIKKRQDLIRFMTNSGIIYIALVVWHREYHTLSSNHLTHFFKFNTTKRSHFCTFNDSAWISLEALSHLECYSKWPALCASAIYLTWCVTRYDILKSLFKRTIITLYWNS